MPIDIIRLQNIFIRIINRYDISGLDGDDFEKAKNTILSETNADIVYDETLPADMLELYERVKNDLNLKEINMSSLSRLSQKNIDSSMDYMTIMYQNLRALDDAFEKNC